MRKKRKEGSKGYHPRWAQKLIFHIRTVKRNRNEIEAQKSDFEHPTKKKKMKENERKRKKNEDIWIHTQNPRRFPGFTVVVVT